MKLLLLLLLCTRAAAADTDEAKQHYDNGAAAYDRGEYQLAVEEFQRSWEIAHNAAMLFNLARAEAKLGHDEAALAFLHQYLEALPDSPDVPAVRSEIEAREKALAERRAREQEEAATLRRDRDQATAARAATRHRLRAAGWSLFAVGLAVAAGGIGSGVLASHDSSTVQNGGGKAPVPFNRVADAAAEGPIAFRAGVSLDVVGGAMAVVGAGLLGWSYRF